MITSMLSFLTLALSVATTIFNISKPVITWVLGLLWKVLKYVTPLVFHELYNLGVYVFSHAQSDTVNLLDKYDVLSKLKVIGSEIVTHVKTIWAAFTVQDRVAILTAPVVVIAVLIYFL